MPRNTDLSLYVDAAVGSSGNGLSWATAFKTIAEAVTKLNSYAVVKGNATINIKTGTYAEPICINKVICARLNITPDSGDVTLTGTWDWVGWTIGCGITAITAGSVTVGSATYKIIVAPSSLATTSSNYFMFQHCPLVTAYISGDGNAYKAANTVNGITLYGTTIYLAGATLSNFDVGIMGYYSTIRTGTVSGTGNTTGLNITNGSIASKGTSYTLSGTTVKADGSVVFTSAGALE